eukprot:c12865_g2_i1 orf=167-355(+)
MIPNAWNSLVQSATPYLSTGYSHPVSSLFKSLYSSIISFSYDAGHSLSHCPLKLFLIHCQSA